MNERIPLSFLLTQNAGEDPPVEPTVPFAAMFGDSVKIVTAVLDRTAVLSEPSDRYDRISVKHDQVLVDPAAIEWRTKTSSYEGHRILNDRMKPGSNEAKGSMHLLRQSRNGSNWRQARVIAGAEPGAEARQASDERALQNQRDVAALKERELAAHRQRTTKRIEEEAMSTVITETRAPDTTSTAPIGIKPEKTKRCVICGNDKPAADFPVGPRGPQRCLDCRANNAGRLTLPPLAAPAIDRPTDGDDSGVARKTPKARARAKLRRGKKPKVGGVRATAVIVDELHTAGEARHTKVLALMRRQDALRADLNRVSKEILELVAAG